MVSVPKPFKKEEIEIWSPGFVFL